MPEDLPIYSESVLRTRSQFADLEKLKSVGTATVWEKSDKFIEQFEGAVDVRHARESLTALTKPNLLHAHAILFSGRENAGILRQEALSPVYRGQDCPAPQFIDIQDRSEEHTSELQSRGHLVCRLLLEKKK